VVDTQILSSAITGLGAVVAGFVGGKRYSEHSSDRKCEKICALTVNCFDKLLTALEVAGEPPAVKVAVRDARDALALAKGHLGLMGGGFDHPNDTR